MKIETEIILLMLFKLVSLFNPVVEWSCATLSIYVDIKTDLEFNGIVHSTGHRSDCYVYGKNSTLTNLIISMQPNDNNPCGVKMNEETDIYSVEIEVHKNVIFSLIQDRTFNINCTKRPTYFNTNDTKIIDNEKASFSKLFVNLELLADEHNYLSMIDTLAYVKYGESYFLKVSLENVEYARRFRITDCIAESEGLVAELIDPNGCSINDETKNFNYEDGHATALIPSFFRFFNFKLLKIECKISICDQSLGCQPRCDKFATNPIEIFNQTVFPAQINYFKIASLTMHVLDENSSNDFFKNDHLLFYVIIFGLLLIIIFCCIVLVLCYIKYQNQKEFFNNFFRPFHNYRNTAFEANDCTNQKSRRSSLTRFADHIRRSSAPTPTLTPTPTFYLMEMTAVPQNFHPFKLSSILHNSDAESTNSVNETSSNTDHKNEIDKNETSTL